VIGKHLNNYEIVSVLGEGGMGTVYQAVHPIMGRKAAIKVLKPELARDESLVRRFFNEARAANAIRHPNIIDIIDVGMVPEENVPYMLMELLEGESLSARLERVGCLSVEAAIDVASQTASALEAAHAKGIVHRDLKPDNLFLIPDPMIASGERVKVLDFGIAKLRDDLRGGSAQTRTGAVMGTATYMSPEQCQGQIDRIDQRTDIYALGIILYQMLCGAPPFVSEALGDLIIRHVMQEPPHPKTKNPSIPDTVAAAILRALAKEPRDRFQSMTELRIALRGHGAATAPRVSTSNSSTASVGESAKLGLPSTAATVLKEPTTFRTSTGEATDVQLGSARKRKAWVAAVGVVGLAAAGVVVALLATGPSQKPDATSPRPIAPAATALPPPSTPAPDTRGPEPAVVSKEVPEQVAPVEKPKPLPARPRKPSSTTSQPLRPKGGEAPHRTTSW
jgi:eukaryotic-like serine/threonine-protein kinase